MEIPNTTTAHRTNLDTFANYSGDDELAAQRLETLLAINLENARQKSLYRSEKEKIESESMKRPLSIEKTFAYFGLLLGTFPPASLFLRIFKDANGLREEDLWIVGIIAIVNLVTATVGYFSGKLIGKIVRELEKTTWNKMLFTLPVVGILWGVLSGGAGGIIIFIIGAFFGAFIGATVGGAALPAFAVFHRLLKRGDKIERSHFLPLAFGIALIISAFILGL